MGKNSPANQVDSAGSPHAGEPVFLVVGKLRRPHGLEGDMLMEVLTDFPERFIPGNEVFVGESFEPMTIKRCSLHGNLIRIAFEKLSTREKAGHFRNTYVYVPSEDSKPLPDGDYYHHQLIGLQVVNEDGGKFGIVDKLLETGANDVMVVLDDHGQEILLPLIDDVILDIDLEKGQILVHILPGLLPD